MNKNKIITCTSIIILLIIMVLAMIYVFKMKDEMKEIRKDTQAINRRIELKNNEKEYKIDLNEKDRKIAEENKGKSLTKEEYLKALEKSFGLYDEDNNKIKSEEKVEIKEVDLGRPNKNDIYAYYRFSKGNINAFENKKESKEENTKINKEYASDYDEELSIDNVRKSVELFLDYLGFGPGFEITDNYTESQNDNEVTVVAESKGKRVNFTDEEIKEIESRVHGILDLDKKTEDLKLKITFLKNKENKLTYKVKAFDLVIYREELN